MSAATARPANVGILAIEVYIPNHKVTMEDLEATDGCSGKYTKGLEQVALSIPAPCEDAVSMALTCVHSLLDKYSIDPRRLGRLDVGSESSPDRCKSIKSHLMRLVASAGNHDIEGCDCVHACYGGTAALFNAMNWVESSSWDGRYALVVCTDIASYSAKSPARATGGCGAVAMLVGPNAPLVSDPAWRATYCENTQEFCKPAEASTPMPVFDGHATIQKFMKALDCTYIYLYRRLQRLYQRMQELGAPTWPFDVSGGILPTVDFYISHAPYARLVRKSFARLALHDALRAPNGEAMLESAGIPARWRVCEPDALPGMGYEDKALESALLTGTTNAYTLKVSPGAWVQQQVGNSYTASLYMGLASLWEAQGSQLEGRRLLCFSFGSGTMATLFALVGRQVGDDGGQFTLQTVANKLQLRVMVESRNHMAPAAYDTLLQEMEQRWGQVPRTLPPESFLTVRPRTWVLTSVDEQRARHYSRRGLIGTKGLSSYSSAGTPMHMDAPSHSSRALTGSSHTDTPLQADVPTG